MSKRKQINVRLEEDVLTAIEDIRLLSRPIPTVSDVIRAAVLDQRDRIKRKIEAQEKK